MIKIEHTKVSGWEAAFRGLRNPMNSWDKSDSNFDGEEPQIGKADLELALRMNKTTAESKYRRFIIVTMDVTAPMYWWKEFDTYKVGTVRNSCSTMHKITAKEFTLDDFSHEHLILIPLKVLDTIVLTLNKYRKIYLQTKDKKYWWQLIQLLPSSYNQRSTLLVNYEVLAKIYKERKNHKLDEWHAFCDWIKSLPYSELITGEDNHE